MDRFLIFLLKSTAILAFIFGAVVLAVAGMGRLGRFLTLEGRLRAAAGGFGALLMVLAVAAFVISSGQGAAGTPSTLDTSQMADCTGRETPETPCLWPVEARDNFESIAMAVYGERQHLVTLIGLNRDDEGYRRSLHTGERVFVPDLSEVPLPPYPDCVPVDAGTQVLPCLYQAEPGDTYRSVAGRFYRTEGFVACIRRANFTYDGVNLALLGESLDSDLGGHTIVVPVPRDSC